MEEMNLSSDGEFLPDYYLLKKRKSQLVASFGAGNAVVAGASGKKMKTGSIEGKTKPNCCLDCLQRLDDPNLKVTLYQNEMVNWYFSVFFFYSFTPVHH